MFRPAGRQYTLRAMVSWPRATTILAAIVAFGLVYPPRALLAHDIPNDVTVQAFVKPDNPPAGQGLRLLVRVPLRALRDVDFPTRGPGDLDLGRIDGSLRTAALLWLADDVAIYEDGARLGPPTIAAARVSLFADKSFTSYEAALAHVLGDRLPETTAVRSEQAMLDVLFEYPIRSTRSAFSIQPSLARLGVRVVTSLRFVLPNGGIRAFEYAGDPGLVRLDPRWHQAALAFVRLGFVHILGGADHLLFLICLVIPVRQLRPLVLVVTAFTAAHSMTLIAAASGMAPAGLWFPPFVETMIAASIVYMAIENIIASPSSAIGRRWIAAFAFGLVHGFGFSFALGESLQFAGSHLLTSLLSFNIGVELGQLAALLILVPALHIVFRFVVAERPGVIILSVLVAHTAWHWTADRVERLRQFGWPAIDILAVASAMRWAMAILVVGGIIWWMRRSRLKSPAAIIRALFTSSLLLLIVSPKHGMAQTAPAAEESTMSGVYSPPQAVRGEETYMGLCVSCHPAAMHTGATFKTTWGGRPVSDLFSAIKDKMPKNEPGTLTPEETAQLVAYLLKLNEVPAGKTELPVDNEALKRIRIETPSTRQ
jgi:HupE / UreJ protein/Cytochrome C oxidase, cbb3-type, subunit III